MAFKLPDNINVVWKPLEGRVINGKYYMSSQELVLSCNCDTIFMSSSRASGKTEVSLIKFCLPIGMGYGSYYRGVYIDMHYKDLNDVIARSKRLFPMIYGNKARYYSSRGDEHWTWDTGEELWFRQGATDEDYNSFHGQEFAVILYNELSKNPTPDFFDKMRTTNRTSFNPYDHPYYIDAKYYKEYGIERRVKPEHPYAVKKFLPPLRPKIIITTNPSGAGKQWVKERFVDPAPAGKIVKTEIKAYNPQTKKDEIMVKTQVHIFSSYKENTHLSPEYVLELESIKDPELRKAWLYGDWNASYGDGMFNDIFRTSIHVVPQFKIPDTWNIYTGFDWGWSKPFATLWLAVSDGSDIVLPSGAKRRTVRGDIFIINEYYGCVKGKANTGVCMLARDVGREILEREIGLGYKPRIVASIADNAIFSKEDGHCIADEMRKPVNIAGKIMGGKTWIGADKRAGSRAVGWNLIKQRLKNAVPETDVVTGVTLPREEKGLFVCDNCRDFLRTFPNLPRDEKKDGDIDTSTEDHLADALRYAVSYIDHGERSVSTYGMN
jgi:hypothetical protein